MFGTKVKLGDDKFPVTHLSPPAKNMLGERTIIHCSPPEMAYISDHWVDAATSLSTQKSGALETQFSNLHRRAIATGLPQIAEIGGRIVLADTVSTVEEIRAMHERSFTFAEAATQSFFLNRGELRNARQHAAWREADAPSSPAPSAPAVAGTVEVAEGHDRGTPDKTVT
ncbi:MAG: hypothetical protein EBR02_02955 [Alphaproteobacteria bacterium]|nr:hypothetical protein [Alphaproteobacteria bacterium]